MARIRALVLRHRKQRCAENYFHVSNNQSFRVRNGGLPLQSEGEVPFDKFAPLENACAQNNRAAEITANIRSQPQIRFACH